MSSSSRAHSSWLRGQGLCAHCHCSRGRAFLFHEDNDFGLIVLVLSIGFWMDSRPGLSAGFSFHPQAFLLQTNCNFYLRKCICSCDFEALYFLLAGWPCWLMRIRTLSSLSLSSRAHFSWLRGQGLGAHCHCSRERAFLFHEDIDFRLIVLVLSIRFSLDLGPGHDNPYDNHMTIHMTIGFQ